LQMNMKKLRA